MNIETELRTALGDVDRPSFDPDPITEVSKRARRRTTRTRLLAAAAGVAAIAGIGLGLGTVRTDAPSALLTTDETEETDVAEVAEVVVEGALDARRPDPSLVVSDGDGGFIGADADQFWSVSRGTRAEFRWSPDGESWRNVGELTTGDARLQALQRVDDEYVAFLTAQTSAYELNGVRVPAGIPEPNLRIATSSDLQTWEMVDIPITYPVIDAPYDRFSVYYFPLSVSRHDGRLLLQLGLSVEPARVEMGFAEGEYCGQVDDERGMSILRCDGTLFEIVDRETLVALGLDQQQRFFVSDAGGPMVEIDPGLAELPATIVATDEGFVTNVGLSGQVVASTNGVEWAPVIDLPADVSWFPAAAGPGAEVAFFGSPTSDEADFVVAHVDVSSAKFEVSSLPVPEEISARPISVGYGRGGWAMLANVRSYRSDRVTEDGWTISSFSGGGSPGRLPASFLLAEESSLVTNYEVDGRTPTVIERGLFGEMRFLRPGTDEVLIQVDRTEFESTPSEDRVAVPDGFDGPYERDGWQVAGDPLQGPLVITDPDGLETTFDDGFAFTNGDISDGVELLDGDPVTLDDGDLTIYQDGQAVWSTPFADVIQYLVSVAEAQGGADQPVAGAGDAWVFHSVDGKTWTIVTEFEDAGFGDFPRLVVGDEEAVVLPFRPPEADFISVELPD